MAMMVTSIILSAVVSLSWALSTVNHEGEASVELATHARFAMTMIGRDMRSAKAAGVTGTYGLLLWMGDLNENGYFDLNELICYSFSANDRSLSRLTSSSQASVARVSGDEFRNLTRYRQDQIEAVLGGGGAAVGAGVICRNLDHVYFYANRGAPRTRMVEIALVLGRQEDRVGDDGRDIEMSVYGSATMRAPHEEDGFDPQR